MARVDIPLIRRRDRTSVGALTLIRTTHCWFADRDGARLPNPLWLDTLIVEITSPTGERVTWDILPVSDLEGPVIVEPADPEDDAAFIAELMRG